MSESMTQTVDVTRDIPRDADAVWAVARDFCSDWHPAIERVWAERAANGGLIRCFEAAGDDSVYREQLTFFSDSDRTLQYTLLDGIAGIEHYHASLTVTPVTAGQCQVRWGATVSGPAARIAQVARGTEAIFGMGIDTLATVSNVTPAKDREPIPATPTPFTLDLPGNPALALSVSPEADGPVVLCLHGIGGNRSNWSPQFSLQNAGGRFAALDLRGYGASALGPAQSTVDDYCDDILRVREAMGVEHLVLCGLSYGAWIATAFAHRHPETLSGLVLCGGCTGMSEASADEQARFRASREAPLDAGQVPADFAPAVVDVIAGPAASPATREALRASMASIPAATYRDALHCFTRPTERFDFAPLDLPVMLITGEHDRLAPPDEIRSVAARVHAAVPRANVRFEVIRDAGHVCNLEQPDAVNRLLADFLAKVQR